jgi:hypothetical protein
VVLNSKDDTENRTLNMTGQSCDPLHANAKNGVTGGWGVAASSPDTTASGWGQVSGSVGSHGNGKLSLHYTGVVTE